MGLRLCCRGAQTSGLLRHSVLKNIVLRLSADELARLCVDEPMEIERCRTAAVSFRDSLPDGFSPRCLLETNRVLAVLDPDLKRKLADRLDALYAERFLQTFDGEDATAKVGDFLAMLTAFQLAARDGSVNGQQTAHADLLDAAHALLTVLGHLPAGVWLP